MSTHRRPPRPYRGGKRRLPVYDFSTPEPHAERPVGKPGEPNGPGHLIDLAFDPNQPRDRQGRWSETAASALNKAIHGDVEQLEKLVRADQGPARIKMPQLSGVPIPGSKADQIPHAPGEEVDLTSQFEVELRAKGYEVDDTSVPVRFLKPTQDQLVGAKVAGLAKYMLNAPLDSPVWEPIFVSADDHVIDGHHRWAARTVKDQIQGHPTDRMDVRKINVDIETALRLATQFMDEWGLPRQGTSASASPTVSHFATNLSNVDLAKHPQPAGYVRETEEIRARRKDNAGRHKFKRAKWTHPNGHPRCRLCGQEESIDGYCSAQVDLAFDPNQPRDAKGQWTASAANVVSMWKQTTPGEREAGEQWYPLAHQTALALSKKYGVSKEEAAGLLAAYSPQTPWGRDQVEASESLRYGHGVGGKAGAVWFTHDDDRVEDRVGVMATGQTRKLADDIMAGGDFDTLTAGRNKDGSLKPASPKIRAFYHLIAAGGQDDPSNPRVVIDRHAMSVAYGERVTNDDYTRMRPGSAKKYKPFVDAYVEAAREISAMEGRTVSPETVQAATWLAQQRQNAAQVTQVGKTRKALGNRDWDEWTKYAKRYLGLDTAGGAKVGYSDLAIAMRDRVIDLAFDPNQPRDMKGRWTQGVGSHLPHAAGGDLFTEQQWEGGGNIGFDDFGYALPPGPGEADDVALQKQAQQHAETWANDHYDRMDHDHMTPADKAAFVWGAYQVPEDYGSINKCLRGVTTTAMLSDGRGTHIPNVSRSDLAKMAKGAFVGGGTTTPHDMTTYRALRSKDRDWADILQPGTTFTEDGIVSTTAYRRFAQGWIGLSGTRSAMEHLKTVNPDAAVLEIRVPKGSRILGGSTGFCETMLPPGTKFKVVSSRKVKTPNAENPLSPGVGLAEFAYTHIVVEAILPDWAQKGTP